MVNNVFAASGLPFQANQLRNQAVVVEQIDKPRIDGGKQVEIEIGFWLFCGNVADAEFEELFAQPFAGVSVAR